ncbi:hypothetical protein AK812_SmicGene34387 [Symbiodinium microadriaticum]|uniref:Uncharacterized protein n=1 Tax=Symbiodinium microadriaticum TaxID=2951 RepID=A0A1Q9CP28_SYMMI|nr:hypothetical protein AK812_SmicGene34387 [Symbiodinium microadriaticum]
MWPSSFPISVACASSETSPNSSAEEEAQFQRDKSLADELNQRFQNGIIVKLLATRPGGIHKTGFDKKVSQVLGLRHGQQPEHEGYLSLGWNLDEWPRCKNHSSGHGIAGNWFTSASLVNEELASPYRPGATDNELREAGTSLYGCNRYACGRCLNSPDDCTFKMPGSDLRGGHGSWRVDRKFLPPKLDFSGRFDPDAAGLKRTTPTLEEQPEETREGVVLLYEPNPLDAWIGKQVQQQPGGTYAYTESGEALTKKEVKQYKAFCRRHSERGEEARLADKLFHIVDKHLPLQADETRAYIARFPGEARKLLPKARKIRNTFRRQGGLRTTTECQPTVQEGEESPQAADVSAYAMPAPSMPGEAMTAERVRRENLEEDAAREKKEQPVDSDTPPDWGGDTDDEGPPPNWPWGTAPTNLVEYLDTNKENLEGKTGGYSLFVADQKRFNPKPSPSQVAAGVRHHNLGYNEVMVQVGTPAMLFEEMQKQGIQRRFNMNQLRLWQCRTNGLAAFARVQPPAPLDEHGRQVESCRHEVFSKMRDSYDRACGRAESTPILFFDLEADSKPFSARRMAELFPSQGDCDHGAAQPRKRAAIYGRLLEFFLAPVRRSLFGCNMSAPLSGC